MLDETFNLCDPITHRNNITNLSFWVAEAYAYMAMTNYPYETGFLKKLPAWPANYSCNALEDVNINSSNEILFSAISESVDTYYNYEGTEDCNQIYDPDASSDADMAGWDI